MLKFQDVLLDPACGRGWLNIWPSQTCRVCRCASLSLRPLTCDDMKGHRWGPWEQSCMQLHLEAAIFPVIRLWEKPKLYPFLNHEMITNVSQIRVNLRSSCRRCFRLQWTQWLERIPQTFQASWKAKKRQRACLEGAVPFGWLCALNTFNKKTAKVLDPDIWFTRDY